MEKLRVLKGLKRNRASTFHFVQIQSTDYNKQEKENVYDKFNELKDN